MWKKESMALPLPVQLGVRGVLELGREGGQAGHVEGDGEVLEGGGRREEGRWKRFYPDCDRAVGLGEMSPQEILLAHVMWDLLDLKVCLCSAIIVVTPCG